MLPGDTIQDLRQSLRTEGRASLTDPDGNVLALISTGLLGIEAKGRLLVAYENKGCFFYDGERPLNQFRLVKAGFSIDVAPFVANVVNAIIFGNPAETQQAKALTWEGN